MHFSDAHASKVSSRLGSRTSRKARWRAWPSMFYWFAPEKKRVSRRRRRIPASCWRFISSPMLWVPLIDLDKLRSLAATVETALSLEPLINAMSERYTFMDHAVAIARGLNYSNAFEFALKLMETCYVVAERFSAADLLHGPIAMVEHSFPSFVFAPSGVAWPGLKETLGKAAEPSGGNPRHHRSEAIGRPRIRKRVVCLPVDLPELYTPIPYIVPAQLFAARLAEHKGLNPDEPRTLSKVTKTL